MNKSLLGGSAILLAVVLGFAVFVPQVANLRQLSAERQAKAQYVQKLDQYKTNLTTVQTAFAANQDTVTKLLEAMPTDPQVPDILTTLDAIAHLAGVTIQSVSPQVDQSNKLVVVQVSGQAAVDHLDSFYQYLQQNNRPISVTDLSLSPADSGGTGDTVSFTITISLPYNPATATGVQ